MSNSNLLALLLTCISESLVFVALLRNQYLKALGCIVLINLFTQPLAQALYRDTPSSFLLIEVAVILIEGVLLHLIFRLTYQQSLVFSLLLNVLSASLGILVFWL